MLPKHILFPIYAILFISRCFAGDNNSPVGARAAGIAGASVGLADVWSVYTNQAGLTKLNTFTAGVCYEQRFALKELSLKSIALALPLKQGVFACSLASFGFELYRENSYGIAFAKKLGNNFSTGVKLNYYSFKLAEGFNTTNLLGAEAGIQAEVIKGLNIAAQIGTISSSNNSNTISNRIYLPHQLSVGVLYQFSEKIFIALQTDKNLSQKAIFKIGVEYAVLKTLYLRAGIATNPTLSAFGMGFYLKNISIDFAFSMHQTLGYTPQIGMLYNTPKRSS